jgi:putative ATP-dependent endonuclease of the OLD family
VEFSPPGQYSSKHTPLGISLRDKHVEVPLSDWGSGTQNRTQILMSILQANRIKTTYSLEDKITPIVVIEEPESFLHPSAQSEFGRILGALSLEFGVQIIATTHSPYMLNREDPGANILLCREKKKGKQNQTGLVDTSGPAWMAPFAEHLGINPQEFSNWQPFFSSHKSKILLVEGELDKQYFQDLQQRSLPIEPLSQEVEIVPYGGKDTLKNTLLVKFVLSKFDQVFITYDHDADDELTKALVRLGLKENDDFVSLGENQPGKDCIEGLLPQRVLAAVNGRETDLVMKLSSRERRDAKQQLKNLYLEEFRKNSDYIKEDLKNFEKAIRAINKRFAKT